LAVATWTYKDVFGKAGRVLWGWTTRLGSNAFDLLLRMLKERMNTAPHVNDVTSANVI